MANDYVLPVLDDEPKNGVYVEHTEIEPTDAEVRLGNMLGLLS